MGSLDFRKLLESCVSLRFNEKTYINLRASHLRYHSFLKLNNLKTFKSWFRFMGSHIILCFSNHCILFTMFFTLVIGKLISLKIFEKNKICGLGETFKNKSKFLKVPFWHHYFLKSYQSIRNRFSSNLLCESVVCHESKVFETIEFVKYFLLYVALIFN